VSNPNPHASIYKYVTQKSKLFTTVSTTVLVSSPLWNFWPDVTSCRKFAVWNLRLLSAGLREDGCVICSAITQWSESSRTHNHTLLSHLRLPQPGGPGSRIYSRRNRVAQLYSRALGSLYLSYTTRSRSRSRNHITTDGQSVSMSRYRAHSGTCDQILLSVRRLFSEICYLVSLGRSLWRGVGSVIFLSHSSNLPVFKSNILRYMPLTVQQFIYSIYKASFSPVWVQQIMLY
jgi:hypothetical protein